jgi:hypothetical protein
MSVSNNQDLKGEGSDELEEKQDKHTRYYWE